MKPFHFGPDFQKEVEDLLEAYLCLTASVEALRPILEEQGIATDTIAGALTEADARFVRFIRAWGNQTRVTSN